VASISTANTKRGVADLLGTTSIHRFILDTIAAVSQLSDNMHAIKVIMDIMLGQLDEVRALLSLGSTSRLGSTVQTIQSVSIMSRDRPVFASATTKYSYKGVAITNASKVVAVMICTIVNICVELHGGDRRDLLSSTLDMRYLGLIVKLVIDRMPSNMRDSFAFSNDSMNSVKLSLYTTHTTGTMVISEATFVNARASWRNQINTVEWTLAVLVRLH